MAATFIPVSTLTIFGVERGTIYIPSLKTLVSALFFQASLEPVIASSTFRHTTGIDSLTSLKLSISTFLNTLTELNQKKLALNSTALTETGLDQAHGSTCL